MIMLANQADREDRFEGLADAIQAGLELSDAPERIWDLIDQLETELMRTFDFAASGGEVDGI